MKGSIMDSFDKGWFVLQTYSGYENKVKENLLQRAQTYNMWIIFYVLKFQHKQCKLKKWKRKEVEEKSLSRLCSCRNGHDRLKLGLCSKYSERYRICRITREQIKTNSIIGTRKFVTFWYLWDKLFKNLISMLRLVKLYVLLMVLLQTTLVRLQRLITIK